jgi:hypothetical protein
VLKSREKKVVTLDIGPFYAKETVLYNEEGAVYPSLQLRSLVPYRCTFGYDVLVYVGCALFLHCRTEKQVIENLRGKNISIPAREIGYLGRKFIVYLAIAHRQSQQRLKKVMELRGGYILHIDGTCEGGRHRSTHADRSEVYRSALFLELAEQYSMNGLTATDNFMTVLLF